ncbi:MAG: hypothetical protein GIKADHBN_01024 [Phycisphaerales bacterium]|nr:hypothetical protein [Phycisphaerales bacterium]
MNTRICVASIAFVGVMLPVWSAQAGIHAATFDQLSWHGLTSSQPLSPWGRVTFEFDRQPELRYLNVSIRRPGDAEPTWVIRNMGVAGYDGVRTDRVSTMLDLGTDAGEMVTLFDYGISLGTALDAAPAIDRFDVQMHQLDYQIGGVAGRDSGDPGDPPSDDDTTKPEPIIDVVLPGRDAFVNQVQDIADCAVGAVSNSLKYLKATGRGGELEDGMISMPTWEERFGRDDEGLTPPNWMTTKKQYFDANPDLKITTTFIEGGLTLDNLKKIAEAVRQGQDVEIVLDGHVVVAAGVRVYKDGDIEIDVFDDNQKDEQADPMRTARGTVGGKLDGKDVVVFVLEVPAPATALTLAAPVVMTWNSRRRRPLL